MGGEVAFAEAAELVRDIVQPDEARGLPYVGLEHIEQGTLSLTDRGSASDVTSAKFRFRKGDILFGKLRPYFRKVVRAPFDGICSTDIWVVRAKTGFDQGYLFYWMAAQDFVDFASGGSEGTRMPRAKWEYVARFTRPRLELPEQRAIAHILGTLDDKIELNRRMNETLEAMAQALFKSWFVDFDPVVVNALRAGNPIPDKFAKRAAHYRIILRQQNPQKNSPLPWGEGLGVREKLPPKLLAYARALRKNQTDAERLMWRLLRNRQFLGIKFRRQHPIEPYIVDFYAHELGLVIEIDGGHHAQPKQKAYDKKRTAFLQEKGLMVIRYWANDVLNETEAVLKDLYQRVVERKKQLPSPPAPLPGGEGSIFPEHILRLFPDRFVESELGPIPEGWEVKALDQIAHFQNGLALQKYRPKPGEIKLPVVKIAQLRSGRADSGEWASANIRPECIIDDGDVIFSWSGSLLLKVWCGGRAALNQHLFKVTSEEFPKWFFYHWIAEHLPEFIQIASDKATTMGHIKRHHLSESKCTVPDRRLIEATSSRFESIFQRQIQNELESRTLAALRDTLLPKLISGELKVQDVEKILEDV